MTNFEAMVLISNFLETATVVIAVVSSFIIAGKFVELLISGIGSKPNTHKKDYQDEMSIYDDQPVQQIDTLPYHSGISLDQLTDGELPDSIYKGKS